ncbi:nuclear transport factor 2 family protein [Hymenobacter sp. PAMC 26628]|uniref:nuclear transport factor 2 family protein n=1 Tax=Hymenobacter sp. PAMC 26628 TaxID=1484118 RepID=UPI00076FE52D|nr:nuclear transport factor 2 family protein [Hymenobacter sp. PAMC 26628]AMJ67809.1 hypothetical protein AXW84_22070 [Hymenobacter sp. PAMC 26628]
MSKTFWWGVALAAVCLPALARAQTPTATEARNKQLIRQTFAKWTQGKGTLYDLLAPNAQWTLTGSSLLSKTYTSKQQFIDATVTPLFQRLSTPFVPRLQQLYAEGDEVIATFDGTGTANDGKPYHNTYCLLMTLKGGQIVRTVAYLDLLAYMELLHRVPARP